MMQWTNVLIESQIGMKFGLFLHHYHVTHLLYCDKPCGSEMMVSSVLHA